MNWRFPWVGDPVYRGSGDRNCKRWFMHTTQYIKYTSNCRTSWVGDPVYRGSGDRNCKRTTKCGLCIPSNPSNIVNILQTVELPGWEIQCIGDQEIKTVKVPQNVVYAYDPIHQSKIYFKLASWVGDPVYRGSGDRNCKRTTKCGLCIRPNAWIENFISWNMLIIPHLIYVGSGIHFEVAV